MWLPQQAPWLEDLRIEFASFPQGRHDDQVDSISQFLAWHFESKGKRMMMIRLGGFLARCGLGIREHRQGADVVHRLLRSRFGA